MTDFIAERFERFSKLILDPDVSATQRSEMKKAFYCGFVDAIECISNIPGSSSGQDIVNVIDDWAKEFDDYAYGNTRKQRLT